MNPFVLVAVVSLSSAVGFVVGWCVTHINNFHETDPVTGTFDCDRTGTKADDL